jgi:metallophosphoesterase superfamily enzyme
MTLDEFDEYLSTFDLNNLSIDDKFNIGCAFRNVTEKKSWDKLAHDLHIQKSGNAFRCWIKDRIYKENGYLPATPKEVDATEQKRIDLYKQQVTTRDYLNQYNALIRDEARIDNFKNLIKEEIAKLPELKWEPNIVFTDNGDKEAILMLSDLHIGATCDSCYNTYNVKVAEERLTKLVNATIHYCREHRVNKLNIVNLGDMIQGLIHVSSRVTQETDVVSQIMLASELVAQVINTLANYIENVTYRYVSDNHSRAIANKHEHIEKENFGRIMQWYLEARLGNIRNITFEDDNLDFSIGLFEVYGKKIAFAHGHLDKPEKAFANFVGVTRQFVDIVLLAHYHNEFELSKQGMKVYVNGSIMGSDDYAFNCRLFSDPCQTLLIFNKNNNDIVNISINLK